ncbi:MAG: sigma-70 family RNA polymerase sigma factor [Nitrospirota bacterium]|nr:sigma-70 family RNA polymerase sigma factor [Nitrospirota bacterium]MDH5699837.1 sigma-70 family RNA polymerase sigma factor [Nitrospirota bacterium]
MSSTNWQDLTDSDLLKACVPNNEEAFAALYQRYEKRVFQYLMTIMNEATLAEETLVEVMLAIWKSLQTFQGQSKVSTWIFGIAHHKAVDALRKITSQQRGGTPLDDIVETAESGHNPLEDAQQNRMAALTNQAITTLSPDHREILHMAFYEELSYPEIAELLHIPVNTVKTRVYYAKQQLKKNLQHQGVTKEIM